MQVKNQPDIPQALHSTNLHDQKISTDGRQQGPIAGSSAGQQRGQFDSDFPSHLPWLNAPAKRLAQTRFHQAMSDRLPYVAARQKVGDQVSVMDGGAALALSSLSNSSTKFFGADGVCWNGKQANTEYLVFFPGATEGVSVGSIDTLLKKKVTSGEISMLLAINALDVEEPGLRKELLPQSRAAYHILLSIGHIFPKDAALADLMVEPMSVAEKAQAFTDIMVLSASSRWPTFLEAGLQLGYDGSKRSALVDRTAVEQARRYSQHDSLLILKRYGIE